MTDGAQDEETGGASAAGRGTDAGPAVQPVLMGGSAPAAASASAVESPSPVDLGRRRFFRQLAAEVFQATATVVGAATALQQTSIQAASAILDPGSALTGIGATSSATANPVQGSPAGFRSAFRMEADRLVLIDQRFLPGQLLEFECRTGADVAWAIREMVVGGAPAIGQVAAYGIALTARRLAESGPVVRQATIGATATSLRSARSTPASLAWSMERMLARLEAVGPLVEDGLVIADALRAEADAMCFEATRDHGLLANHGLAVLPRPADRPLRVLVHGHAGVLGGGQFGTVLGMVQAAAQAGWEIQIHVDETRPYLEGARLTAWELEQTGLPYTLIADAAAGALLASGAVDVVLVGADRVAANGDAATTIGTYPLAVLAARHGVPLYVCVPLNLVDPASADGAALPIEERRASDLLEFNGQRTAPARAAVWNPLYDVTPADLITAFVTEEGVLRAPFGPTLDEALAAKRLRMVPPPAWAGFVDDAQRALGVEASGL